MKDYSAQWEKELEQLKAILLKTSLKEEIKWGAPVYTHNGKNILGFWGFINYFAIWFYQVVFLKDPLKVLVNAGEGKTKALRQWRFKSSEEIDETFPRFAFVRVFGAQNCQPSTKAQLEN